jgi:hypothetical protein
MTLHLGIDIGVQGAIAIVDLSGALVEINDMPVSGWPKGAPCDQCAAARRGHLQEPCGSCLRRRRWRKARISGNLFGRGNRVIVRHAGQAQGRVKLQGQTLLALLLFEARCYRPGNAALAMV